ncbi:MAG: phosphoribosylamine--glycine ligase [Actinomycetota bacterium]|nr:phosphoribosylamine--glycine ligase [Actinomycetota bacterium]
MRAMVVGSGAREHALGWKISKSPLIRDIIFVPGNPGMAEIGECMSANPQGVSEVARIAKEKRVDLTVVGPEAPLMAGIVDELEASGLKVFGPTSSAAKIEGSKSFAKDLMLRNGVPTGSAKVFEDFEEARAHIETLKHPFVIKADGLAAGKGVMIVLDFRSGIEALKKCLVDGVFGDAGKKVLVEEYLEGNEVSILSLSDGKSLAHMEASQDHKRAFDNDKGPNTGGMGAYSPVPFLSSETEKHIHTEIMEKTVEAMRLEGVPYKGVLYGGLILTVDGPKVLEFNVRFGDPETQVVLPRLRSDLVPGLLATVDGTIGEYGTEWSSECCVCVVVASGGYPGKYETGLPIKGLKAASADSKVEIFHAGTKKTDGKLVTAGGRVLNVVALGDDFRDAVGLAYESVQMLSFEGMHYRRDIGKRAIEALEGV